MTIFEKLKIIWEEGYNFGLANGIKPYGTDEDEYPKKYVFIAISQKTADVLYQEIHANKGNVPQNYQYDMAALTKTGQLNIFLNTITDVKYYTTTDGIMNFSKIKRKTWLGNVYFIMPCIIDNNIDFGKVKYRTKELSPLTVVP